MKCSLDISNFFFFLFKRSLVFPFLLLSSISLLCSLRKAFLSPLAILWNSAFRCVYISFYLLRFASLLLSANCKASSDIHFTILHIFFLGDGFDHPVLHSIMLVLWPGIIPSPTTVKALSPNPELLGNSLKYLLNEVQVTNDLPHGLCFWYYI